MTSSRLFETEHSIHGMKHRHRIENQLHSDVSNGHDKLQGVGERDLLGCLGQMIAVFQFFVALELI